MRELNESVKKIYLDMTEAGLPAPEYIVTPNTVKLILRNNIDERTTHRNKASNEALSKDEQIIVEIIWLSSKASQREIVPKTGFTRAKVQRIIFYYPFLKNIDFG